MVLDMSVSLSKNKSSNNNNTNHAKMNQKREKYFTDSQQLGCEKAHFPGPTFAGNDKH